MSGPDPKDTNTDVTRPEVAPPLVPLTPSPTPTVEPNARSTKKGSRATIAGALVVGGIAGAVILGPLTTMAASPTPPTVTAPTAVPSAGTDTDTGTGSKADNDADGDHQGGRGGHTEAVSDTSVAAKAIGISEADLLAALATGKTVADVATAHNVPVQTVIDALVADGQSELAAAVASGQITQAQADAQKAEVTQRATDQVNSTYSGDHH
jgi:hypothetical protein